jgi:hypothetical protein
VAGGFACTRTGHTAGVKTLLCGLRHDFFPANFVRAVVISFGTIKVCWHQHHFGALQDESRRTPSAG